MNKVMAANRLLNCNHWDWMEGMLTLNDSSSRTWRTVRQYNGPLDADGFRMKSGLGLYQEKGPRLREPAPILKHCLPDLDDAATFGCVVAMMSAIYGEDICIFPREDVDGIWWVCGYPVGRETWVYIADEDTKLEALVKGFEGIGEKHEDF